MQDTKNKSLGKTFNSLWSAAIVSNFSDGLLGTAAPLLAATLTSDPVLISMMAALTMLPWLFFAIPIGALVDRINRRTAILVVQSIRVAISISVTTMIATGTLTLTLFYVLVFIVGVSEVLNDTATQSVVPKLLTSDKLERGNSRLQLAEIVMQQFIGTPLGGIFFALAIWLPFSGTGAGYLVAICLVLLIPRQALAPESNVVGRDRKSLFKEMAEGIAYLIAHKSLLRLVLTTTAVGLCFSMATSTSVLYVLHRLNLPKEAFGFLLLVAGVGALLGALAAPKLSKRFGRSTTLATMICVSSVMLLMQGLIPNVAAFAIFGALGGFSMSNWNILLMSTYHQMIPNEIFGRIHGTRRTLVWGMMPVGALLGGALAKIDLQTPWIVGGLIATLVSGLSIRFLSSMQTDKVG